MQTKVKNYLFLILAHVLIGIVISQSLIIAKLYGLLILIVSIYFIIKTKNKNHEILYAGAYVVGSEVFLRMTGGSLSYEFSKYMLIIFSIFGMFYKGFSKSAVPYWIFLILLMPGIVIGANELSAHANVRTTIAFNITGPLSLGFISLYTFDKKITISELKNILLMIGLPVISCGVYLFLFTSNISESLSGTGSNASLSGGFGPNQVSTILGLGMFIFFARVLLDSGNKLILLINLYFAVYFGYRGVLTFSRGGVITGVIMLGVLLLVANFYSTKKSKLKLFFILGFLIISLSSVWLYSSYKSNGLTDKRYANKDGIGRTKADKLTGRGQISLEELQLFEENPLFGVGVGCGAEIRNQKSEFVASHNELTRMLAEHGSLGILALLILFITPLILYVDNKQHIFMLCFLIFWLLTINHAAMRTAAPSFIYALTLLKVKFNE